MTRPGAWPSKVDPARICNKSPNGMHVAMQSSGKPVFTDGDRKLRSTCKHCGSVIHCAHRRSAVWHASESPLPPADAHERQIAEAALSTDNLFFAWIASRVSRKETAAENDGRAKVRDAVSLILVGAAEGRSDDDVRLRRIIRLVEDWEARMENSAIGRVLSGELDLAVFDEALANPAGFEREFDQRRIDRGRSDA